MLRVSQVNSKQWAQGIKHIRPLYGMTDWKKQMLDDYIKTNFKHPDKIKIGVYNDYMVTLEMTGFNPYSHTIDNYMNHAGDWQPYARYIYFLRMTDIPVYRWHVDHVIYTVL